MTSHQLSDQPEQISRAAYVELLMNLTRREVKGRYSQSLFGAGWAIAQPLAMMLDEPFAKLDAPLRQRMRELLFGAVAARGIAAVLVTHDAADVADAQRLTKLP